LWVHYNAKWGVEMRVKHCNNCRDGRLVKHGPVIFCGFCGKEYNMNRLKW